MISSDRDTVYKNLIKHKILISSDRDTVYKNFIKHKIFISDRDLRSSAIIFFPDRVAKQTPHPIFNQIFIIARDLFSVIKDRRPALFNKIFISATLCIKSRSRE